MSIFSKLAVSQDLSKRMAKALEVDLSERFDPASQIGALGLRGVTLRCAACPDQVGCAKLLNATDRLENPPDFCRNKGLLSQLQREKQVTET